MKRKLILIACLIVGMLLLSACGLFPKKEEQPAEEVTVTVSTPTDPDADPDTHAGTDPDPDTGTDPDADPGGNARADAHAHHPVGHDRDDESAGGHQEPYG